jgi:hypothetical protein
VFEEVANYMYVGLKYSAIETIKNYPYSGDAILQGLAKGVNTTLQRTIVMMRGEYGELTASEKYASRISEFSQMDIKKITKQINQRRGNDQPVLIYDVLKPGSDDTILGKRKIRVEWRGEAEAITLHFHSMCQGLDCRQRVTGRDYCGKCERNEEQKGEFVEIYHREEAPAWGNTDVEVQKCPICRQPRPDGQMICPNPTCNLDNGEQFPDLPTDFRRRRMMCLSFSKVLLAFCSSK